MEPSLESCCLAWNCRRIDSELRYRYYLDVFADTAVVPHFIRIALSRMSEHCFADLVIPNQGITRKHCKYDRDLRNPLIVSYRLRELDSAESRSLFPVLTLIIAGLIRIFHSPPLSNSLLFQGHGPGPWVPRHRIR